MDDELMKCATCGTPRASRYAAYCHVCGSPLPELPPDPPDPVDPAPRREGWEGRAAAAGAGLAADQGVARPPDSYPAGPSTGPQAPSGYPAGAGQPGSGLPQPEVLPVRPVAGQPAPSAAQLPADSAAGGGAVRVYDRPETPPSVVRRRRLTWILAGAGVLISLVLLLLGPFRNVLGARSQPSWAPPGTETPVSTIVPTLPPGVSAAQATARARQSPTVVATWTAGVDIGTTAPGGGTPGAATAGGGAAGGAATVTLPTLAPAATSTLAPTATSEPPTATPAPATPTLAPPTATEVVLTATLAPTLTPAATDGIGALSGATLPAAIAGGRIVAFVSDRTGEPQIWVAASGGGDQLQVTRVGQNTSPSWSPDNRYLYYIGQRNGQTGAYRLDITTGIEERLLQDPSIVTVRPLPNGQLAILRTENGRYSLFVGDRRLFQLDRSFQFQFSPDGRRVVIDPNADPRVISVVDVATTVAVEVAPERAWNAGWGQGDRLIYVSDRTGVAAVYVAGPNGEEPRPVSQPDKWSQAPAFSSDGSLIAFIGGDGPEWNVYMVPANGQAPRRVGGPANPSKSPAWQPGGGLLAYESNRAGNWDIYITDANGNERPLTSDPGNDVDPVWTW